MASDILIIQGLSSTLFISQISRLINLSCALRNGDGAPYARGSRPILPEARDVPLVTGGGSPPDYF